MATETTKKPLIHHGYDQSKASKLTFEARWSDPRTSPWYSTTQVWSWEGGDAIVVVTGHFPRATNYVVLRVGNQVHFVEGVGVAKAMAAFGFDPKDYYITTELDLAAAKESSNAQIC
jgi:hypothetical protein